MGSRSTLAVVLSLAVAIVVSGCRGASGRRSLSVDGLPRPSLRRGLRIGSENDPNVGFSSVIIFGMDVDRDGQLYVMDAQERKIRVYSPGGKLVRKIGGPGQGPGEFQGVPRFGVHGDTVWAFDISANRITLFDRSGNVLSASRVEGVSILVPGGVASILPFDMEADGLFSSRLMRIYGSPNGPKGTKPVDELRFPRVRFDASGGVVDTVGWDPGAPPRMLPPPSFHPQPYQSVEVEARRFMVPQPPPELAQWITLDDGQVILDQKYATSPNDGVFTLTRIGLSGDTVYHRMFHYRPRPYTSTVLDSIAIRRARTPNGFINGVRVAAPRNVEAVARAMRTRMHFPSYQLAIQGGWVANGGDLWLLLEDEATAGERWIVLGPEGVPQREVDLSPGTRPLWSRGDTVWVAQPDSMDVPWLVRYTFGTS